MRIAQLKINLQEKSVMIIADIKLRFIDELGQTIVEGVPMDDQGLGSQRGVKPTAQETTRREQKLVAYAFELSRKQRERRKIAKGEFLHQHIGKKKTLVGEIGQGFLQKLFFERPAFMGGQKRDGDPDVIMNHQNNPLEHHRESLIG